jgi:hypothetical protein
MAAELARLTDKIAITTASSGREMYHLQFSLQAVSPETFEYNLVRLLEVIFKLFLSSFSVKQVNT